MKFLVLTKDNCPWCEKLKALMGEHKIEYEEINIEAHKEGWKHLLTYMGLEKPTVPQVFSRVGRDDPAVTLFRIGGYTEFMEAFNTIQGKSDATSTQESST